MNLSQRLCIAKMPAKTQPIYVSLQHVDEPLANSGFFESDKGLKMAAISMSEKTWPH
jgi:hypothetical protein